MGKLIWYIAVSILFIYLIDVFVKGVKISVLPESSFLGFKITERWQVILVLGFVLGLINFFIKPFLDFLTFPLKILTLGIFSIILNMFFLKVLDWLFLELEFQNLASLFFASFILGFVNFFLGVR